VGRPRIAVTLGDPRGIGPEVVARALAAPTTLDADVIAIGPDDQVADLPVAGKVALGVWGTGRAGSDADIATAAGKVAGLAVDKAVELALSGAAAAIVTGPVHKYALHLAGYRFPGLTELLANRAGDVDVAMMLAAARLRVVLVTTHIALRDVPASVTTERVVRIGRITAEALRRWWGMPHPRLALCALNPHAGESGLFGDEDARVLRPAAETLDAVGPLPADTVFVRAMRGEFDAVLAPYHDVGMTAVKVAGFGTGVNVTLGLPFPRTAPDHGTALDIAGKGIADAGSMRAALELGVELARRNAVKR